MTTDHMWVEMQVLPVHAELVEDGGDGEPAIITSVTENAEDLASDDAVHGCYICNTPLNPETINTECPGKDVADEV